MPEPVALCRCTADGQTVVSYGQRLVFRYDEDDTGMRNLAVVALTDAGAPGREVAGLFGLSPEYVSRLRAQARRWGAAGLVRRRGRPPKLSERQVANARRWVGEGLTQTEVAARCKVARSVISELVARLGSLPAQEVLDPAGDEQPTTTEPTTTEPTATEPAAGGSARLVAGVYPSRYAGAALLYSYFDLVDAAGIFATVTGGPARRYDDLAVLASATVGFALGIDTVEGAKHLRRGDAGAVVGITAIPQLRTLRERLAALADESDPLALQRAFAKSMLAADPPTSPVYYVDDHFVAYTGARPVAKGYNTKRRLAEPGRADTLVVDHRGRAVCFASDEPSGLTRSLPGMLTQLREVVGGPRRADPAGFRPRRVLPERVRRLPGGRGGLGHLPAGQACGHHRPCTRVLLCPRRPADQRHPRRRHRRDPRLRPRSPAHLVRARRPGAPGAHQRHQGHRGGAGVLAARPVAHRERLQIRGRAQRDRRDRPLRDGHRPRRPHGSQSRPPGRPRRAGRRPGHPGHRRTQPRQGAHRHHNHPYPKEHRTARPTTKRRTDHRRGRGRPPGPRPNPRHAPGHRTRP
ncbi:MAG: hypothetical protein DLM61_13925, partial [Pseudonocardiales bacterium]